MEPLFSEFIKGPASLFLQSEVRLRVDGSWNGLHRGRHGRGRPKELSVRAAQHSQLTALEVSVRSRRAPERTLWALRVVSVLRKLWPGPWAAAGPGRSFKARLNEAGAGFGGSSRRAALAARARLGGPAFGRESRDQCAPLSHSEDYHVPVSEYGAGPRLLS